MELPEGYEIIESIAVEMDPALDGFTGVLFEAELPHGGTSRVA